MVTDVSTSYCYHEIYFITEGSIIKYITLLLIVISKKSWQFQELLLQVSWHNWVCHDATESCKWLPGAQTLTHAHRTRYCPSTAKAPRFSLLGALKWNQLERIGVNLAVTVIHLLKILLGTIVELTVYFRFFWWWLNSKPHWQILLLFLMSNLLLESSRALMIRMTDHKDTKPWNKGETPKTVYVYKQKLFVIVHWHLRH